MEVPGPVAFMPESQGVPLWPWGLFGNNCRETACNISSWELRLVLWVFSVGDSALCWNITRPVVKEMVKGVMAVSFHQLVQRLGEICLPLWVVVVFLVLIFPLPSSWSQWLHCQLNH